MKKRGTVLVTDGVHPLLLEGFQKAGFDYDYRPKINLEDTRAIIQDYEGIIINSKIWVDKSFLDKAIKLQFIGRLGSGMEIVDQEYAKKKGVVVKSAPEGNRNAVGEHAVGMLLTLANKMLIGDRRVRQKHWNREDNRGFELMGKTVGIIGFGHTGNNFAKKLAGFNVKVLAYDKYKTYFTEGSNYIQATNLDEIFEKADIVSLHLPLNDETHYMFDEKFIQQFKKEIILINTSRGKVVNTRDVIDALKTKKLKGACLDVFENEKPKTFSKEEDRMYDELYDFENVILSPHVAGWTVESKERLAQIVLDKILTSI
jgi:D-3-phosphoglycerate dehydrogenase